MSNALMTADTEMTMSSREIAEVVEARHDNVKITIERLGCKGLVTFTALQEPTPGGGKPRKCYHVNKRDSYVVVAQLSPEFTARLVDRWQELEKQVAQPQVPQSFAEALRLAADTQEQLEHAEAQKQIAESRRDSLQKAVGKHDHTLYRFARTFRDVNAMKIKGDLKDQGYLYIKGGTYRVYRKFYELFYENVDEDYGKVDIFPTEAGKARIADLYAEGKLTLLKR